MERSLLSFFMRLITDRTILFTEMVHANAIVFGERDRFLSHHVCEQPLVLQLGGSDPDLLAKASLYAAQAGYQEVNLNVGCPSERVRVGQFGACLMLEPQRVAECLDAMGSAGLSVSVKCRIGLKNHDSFEQLLEFVDTLYDVAKCNKFYIHARIAVLGGLSPKQNRSIPPLRYDIVEQLKIQRPHLWIALNGGIDNIEDAKQHLHSF